MTEETPSPLNDQTPSRRQPPVIAGVIVGVLAGSLLSFLVYWFGMGLMLILSAVVLVIKVAVGTRLRKDERTRGVAIGILISIATGTLIFLGLCGRALEGI